MSFLDASLEDRATVESLVGRPLEGRFAVVVRDGANAPVVIENEPHLRDGTPMPTLFWLVDPALRSAVSRLEGAGGVKRLESAVDPEALAAAHDAYARRRGAAVCQRDRPLPSGGVGGTRRGVKCLHAHLAHYLAVGVDPVGELVAHELELGRYHVVDVRG